MVTFATLVFGELAPVAVRFAGGIHHASERGGNRGRVEGSGGIPDHLHARRAGYHLWRVRADRADVTGGAGPHPTVVAFASDLSAADALRQLLETVALPETAGVVSALRTLQDEQQHMAVVVDEHGSVAGLVTIETSSKKWSGRSGTRPTETSAPWSAYLTGARCRPGTFLIHDLENLGIDLSAGSTRPWPGSCSTGSRTGRTITQVSIRRLANRQDRRPRPRARSGGDR
jgi:hypothetical protein